MEVDAQVSVAFDLNYLDHNVAAKLEGRTYEILGLLNRLIESLRKPDAASKSETLKTLKP